MILRRKLQKKSSMNIPPIKIDGYIIAYGGKEMFQPFPDAANPCYYATRIKGCGVIYLSTLIFLI